jgi:hypothetical protein
MELEPGSESFPEPEAEPAALWCGSFSIDPLALGEEVRLLEDPVALRAAFARFLDAEDGGGEERGIDDDMDEGGQGRALGDEFLEQLVRAGVGVITEVWSATSKLPTTSSRTSRAASTSRVAKTTTAAGRSVDATCLASRRAATPARPARPARRRPSAGGSWSSRAWTRAISCATTSSPPARTPSSWTRASPLLREGLRPSRLRPGALTRTCAS